MDQITHISFSHIKAPAPTRGQLLSVLLDMSPEDAEIACYDLLSPCKDTMRTLQCCATEV